MSIVKVAKDVILANHHTADIILSRVYSPNPTGDPALKKVCADAIRIPKGGSKAVSAAQFELRKSSHALTYYLDNGLLSVVRREGPAEVHSGEVLDLEVPEHLQPNDDGEVMARSVVDGSAVAASIRRKKRTDIVTNVIQE